MKCTPQNLPIPTAQFVLKTCLAFLLLLAAASTGSCQQPNVTFLNNVNFATPDPTGGKRLVYIGSVEGNTKLVGTNYAAQLCVGPDANSLVPLPNVIARFRVQTTIQPGTWNYPPGSLTLPGFDIGSTVTLQVKVWDSSLFASYEQAVGDGLTGASEPFPYTIPASCAPIGVCFMEGLRAFAITLVTNSCLPVLPGLVNWWRADGTANDSVGTNHGTLMGGAVYSPGLFNQAFHFNGSDAFVEVPDSPSLSFAPGSTATIEFWLFRESDVLPAHFLGKRTACFVNPSVNYEAAIDATSGEIPLRTWIHWAQVYGTGGIDVYTNGVNFAHINSTFGPVNSAPLRIGTSDDCQPFGGLIDEVRIYRRALSLAEIRAVASPRAICPPSALTATVRVRDLDICWNSNTNRTYQVEYRSDSTTNMWLPLGSPVQGNGTTNCVIDSVPESPSKFYRVRVLP